MFDHIPGELKALQQWVCFDVDGGRKVPYTPGTDSMAASNRPRDWRSYRAALKDVESGKRQHLGFCFANNGYVFIDLDDMDDPDQPRVYERINTYCQRSISGEGLHLICKGTFEGDGKHPAFPDAGIFKERRFCLMTGDIVDGRSTINAVDTADLQSIHTWLKGGHGHAEIELVEYKSQIPDQTVFEMGCHRFLKFSELCCGRWEQYEEFHNDHSTADHAFIAMLCDLTESNEQVRWFFSKSGMWNEERAAKKSGHGLTGYADRTIRKIRSSQAREEARNKRIQLDFSEDTTVDVVDEEKVIPPKGNNDLIESLPEGLVKDMARYSFDTSFLPLQEPSLLSAMSLMSVIAGRGFLTPMKSGLNLWLVLVGGTSCGKDEYQNGMKRLITALSAKNPSIRRIFGGEIVSGPGLEMVFQDTLRYVSYIPEFGDTFKNLANPNSQEYTKTLSRGLLNSFNTAGLGGSMEGRKKAQKSDEKPFIDRPCLCIAGEATPESLYGSMSTRELATGFLQRFILLDVPFSSWSLRPNPRNGAKPPQGLVDRLDQLALLMDTADVTNSHTVVPASKEASKMLMDYHLVKREAIMACPEGLAKKEVMNRASMKAFRIATLLAVSADFHAPLVRQEHALWAIRFVEKTDAAILARFDTGEVGSGQVKQELEILKACTMISKLPHADRLKMGFNRKTAPEVNLMPLHVLKKLIINNASFASDKLGAVTAFEKSVDALCKSGVFSKVTPDMAADRFETLRGVLLSMDLKRLK